MRNVLIVSFIGVVCAASALAQASAGGGGITGTIREPAGDGIPDTTVVLSNQELSVFRTMVTSDDGVFYATALVPANGYRLKVTRKGFANWESAEFTVRLGETLNFRIELQAETPATEIRAASVTPQVDDHKIGVSSLKTEVQVKGLPSSERRLDPLVLQTATTNTENGTGQLAFLSQTRSNALWVDGLDTTSGYYGERVGSGNEFSQNVVQEFQVLASGPPAEFGRFLGGAVNAVTPSGTNGYHGSADDYLRLTSMTADGRFSPGQNLLQKQNQAGATLGGPVQEGRIFFFAGVEQLSGHFDGLNKITNPLIADSSGNVVSPANCKATTAQCAAAEKFIQSQMNVEVPFSDRWLSGIGKVDYRRSDRNSFTVEGDAMNSRAPVAAQLSDVAPNGGLLGLNNSIEQTRYWRGSWVSAPLPAAVNELRFGLVQDRWTDPASQQALSTGNLGISLAGANIGATHPYNSLLSEHRYQLVDTFTFTTGSHTLKAGADLSLTRDALNSLPNSAGTYYFNSLTTFAEDLAGTGLKDYSLFTQQFGNPSRAFNLREYNLYGQDTWKVTKGLVVTAGVRFEKPRPPVPPDPNTGYYLSASIPSPSNDFSPRVGLSYLLDDRTVIRAGFGYFFAPYPGQLLDSLLVDNATFQTNIEVGPTQTGAPAFPKVLTSTSIPASTSDLIYAESKLRNPHTQQTSLALERRLPGDTIATLSLIDSRGFKLWNATDLNVMAPTKTGTYVIDNSSGVQVGTYLSNIYTARNDPKYAHIYQVQNGGSSFYNAIALDVRRRMAHGLSLQGSYTWSHAISDTNGPLLLGVIPMNTVIGDSGPDRGNSLTDQRNRGTINFVWQPVIVTSTSPAARFLINGWQVSAIATAASGEPVSTTALPVGQQFSTAAMLYTTSLNGSGGWDRVPFDRVSNLMTQSERNLNVRLTRTLPFTDRVKGMVMLEGYNVLNHQPATAVNTIEYTGTTSLPAGAVSGPTSGVLKPVPGLGVGIASAGYPDGTSARRLQLAFRVVF